MSRFDWVLEQWDGDLRAWSCCYVYLAKVPMSCVEGESVRGTGVSAEKCL
jgi:hypothetical protein